MSIPRIVALVAASVVVTPILAQAAGTPGRTSTLRPAKQRDFEFALAFAEPAQFEAGLKPRGPVFRLYSPCKIDDWSKEMHWNNSGLEYLRHEQDPNPNAYLFSDRVVAEPGPNPGTITGYVHCGDGSNRRLQILPNAVTFTVSERISATQITQESVPFKVGEGQSIWVHLEKPAPASGTLLCVSVTPPTAMTVVGTELTGGCEVALPEQKRLRFFVMPNVATTGVVLKAVANPTNPVQLTFDILP